MSLLLKSVWQHMLRGSLGRTTIRSVTTTLTEVPTRGAPPPDAVMRSLQAAPSAAAVLAAVQTHLPVLTHKHLLQALRTLFELQKAGNRMEEDPQLVIKNPTFGVLCQHFKKHARALELNEAIEATKVLSYLQVPIDSLIVQTMLQLIRYNINSLGVRQIMFLDFLLSRYDSKNHLVDALRLALPLAFQIRLPLELDNEDLPLLKDMLAYSCTHDLPDRCINNIVTGLLLHDRSIDAASAKSVVWSLCHASCAERVHPTRAQLLHVCCDILAQHVHELSYEDMLRTAAKLKGRVLERHYEFYHERLLDALGSAAVARRLPFPRALLLARVLSRLAHTHLGLAEYLCEQAASNPSTLAEAQTNILFGFVNCLSNNNYTPPPDQWAEIKRQISSNPIMDGTNPSLPWAKLCLELASLGHYEDRLLARVFSPRFLRENLARVDNQLDHLQLLTLHEAVRCFHSQEYSLPDDVLQKARSLYPLNPLARAVQEELGLALGAPGLVARHVQLRSGIVADVLVCLKNGYPIPLKIPEGIEKIPIEDLNLPKDCVVACLLIFNQGCYSLNSSRVRGTFALLQRAAEAGGAACAALSARAWRDAPGRERAPLLLRELQQRLAEIPLRLANT